MRVAASHVGSSPRLAECGLLGAGLFPPTLWTKQYNLYAKIDTEGPRYIGFEKYWGGHVY